jgi:hypothetical protein
LQQVEPLVQVAFDAHQLIVAVSDHTTPLRNRLPPDSLGAIDALAVGMDGNVYVMSENAVLRIGR